MVNQCRKIRSPLFSAMFRDTQSRKMTASQIPNGIDCQQITHRNTLHAIKLKLAVQSQSKDGDFCCTNHSGSGNCLASRIAHKKQQILYTSQNYCRITSYYKTGKSLQ